MRPTPIKGAALFAGLSMTLALAACTSDSDEINPTAQPAESYQSRESTDGTSTFMIVDNPGDGATLSYGVDSGVTLLEEVIDGSTYAFKDMNGNGELDTWEDWRVDAAARAADAVQGLSIEQIAGLMLFSSHERSPADGLTDPQIEYLTESRLRNVLNAGPNEAEANVTWSNEMQAHVESLASADEPYIPVNFSTDPRTTAGAAYYNAGGADISRWPSNLGLAATFDPAIVEEFGAMTAEEYRALGIATALSPQIDLATEPRWNRVDGTFGENAELVTELTRAYVDGLQGTDAEGGWDSSSVNAMIKHWPGDAVGEGGRESHWDSGKYAVYPGDNLNEHIQPFLGSLNSAAVMTSYSIAVDGEGEPLFGERVGTAYDDGRMALLRDENGYQGVIVTDWGATRSPDPTTVATAWGTDELTVEERHYEFLLTGGDMFGGNNDVAPVLAAYDMWQADYEAGDLDVDADTRFRQTGARVLTMIFQPGLYDNPYVDLGTAVADLASADKVDAGFQAQLQSVVMLKNDGGAISASEAADWAEATVYIPRAFDTGQENFRGDRAYTEALGLTLEVAEGYFANVVTDEAVLDENGQVVSYTAPDLSEVDVVLVGMSSPNNGNVAVRVGLDQAAGEYLPMSLQYRPYVADGPNVRQTSISGNILADGTRENRSYFGNSSYVSNASHLDALERAVAAVDASGRDIPVITVLKASNPTIPAEFEGISDAIVVGFGISDQALIEVALGLHEPHGRLPITFPASMDAVEAQLEDLADTEPYVDGLGNEWGFGFGLSFAGVISE
ncbi:MAG: glycoside hydrolase family 3 protein [Cellulomonadaceae bacterium]|nr:glycoside hydrolase family 3 protein [Cellulomonadaceae bacterium]